MEKRGILNFEVDQLAEMKSFEKGYRGAWFRCKIKDIQLNKHRILPEYYDFDLTELKWESIYQVPPCSKKSKKNKRQLMVRPQYPVMYQKSERPPANAISQPCVVIDGTWKVGDLVDWHKDDCYWSATVIKVLSDNKFQVELLKHPSGEGGKHVAFGNDFRPLLNWSKTKGWTLPIVEGRSACNAQLIFSIKQGMDLEPAPEPGPAATGSTTRKSGEGDRDSEQNEKSVKMDCDLGMDLESRLGSEPAAAGSMTRKSVEGDRDSEQNEKSVKMDCYLMESSESISSLQRMVATNEVEKRELNITHEHTLESALLDLGEIVAKVKWMQRLLQSPRNDAATSSWKFA